MITYESMQLSPVEGWRAWVAAAACYGARIPGEINPTILDHVGPTADVAHLAISEVVRACAAIDADDLMAGVEATLYPGAVELTFGSGRSQARLLLGSGGATVSVGTRADIESHSDRTWQLSVCSRWQVACAAIGRSATFTAPVLLRPTEFDDAPPAVLTAEAVYP